MQLQFLGVGSAFTLPKPEADGSVNLNKCDFQTNVVATENNKRLLIDCGGDVRFSAAQCGYSAADIDAVYISHLHADHIGGLEWLAFSTFFNPRVKRPKLYIVQELMEQMWEQSLQGGLSSIEGKVTNLTDFFDCKPSYINGSFFRLDDTRKFKTTFTPVQTVHIMSGYRVVNSYGLLINTHDKCIFMTTDTQFCPNQIQQFYSTADTIFHDCETAPFKSGVHAHYDDLKTLPSATKAKMWLTHYQPNPQQDAKADGFKGFVKKGQTFEF